MEHIVQTTSGKVRGYERDQRIDYLGIPYAEAPVGELRFKRSVPKKPWKDILDAKEYGAVPIQLNDGKVIGDEDCLTINVQRPLEGKIFRSLSGSTAAVSIPDILPTKCIQEKHL